MCAWSPWGLVLLPVEGHSLHTRWTAHADVPTGVSTYKTVRPLSDGPVVMLWMLQILELVLFSVVALAGDFLIHPNKCPEP